jgi:hypothetical protein
VTPAPELHPAQNRGLRELVATTRQLGEHWSGLAERLGGSAAAGRLETGARRAHSLLEDLNPLIEARGLYAREAVHSVGKSLAGSRNQVGDRFLERNQALRIALLDVQHVVTLLGYQAEIAEQRGDAELARALRRHEKALLAVERAARKAAIELGKQPDRAIERVDRSPAGRLAHGAANTVGTVGEWVDRRVGG